MTAALERIVRPLIPLNVRPAAVALALPADEEDRGVARIGGASGSLINLNHVYNERFSRSMQDVEFRIYHRIRVYQNRTSGGVKVQPVTPDPDKHIDIQWNLVVRLRNEIGVIVEERYFEPQNSDFVDKDGDPLTWEITRAYVKEPIATSRLPPRK